MWSFPHYSPLHESLMCFSPLKNHKFWHNMKEVTNYNTVWFPIESLFECWAEKNPSLMSHHKTLCLTKVFWRKSWHNFSGPVLIRWHHINHELHEKFSMRTRHTVFTPLNYSTFYSVTLWNWKVGLNAYAIISSCKLRDVQVFPKIHIYYK